MLQRSSLVSYLDSLLPPNEYKDAALNGLQVEAAGETVRKVALAVDAGLSVIESAVAQDADMLVVHHGLFWGREQAITGPLAKKIEILMRSGCSLYASHLPLDGSPEVGNGFELGRFLGLEQLVGFCEYAGNTVGAAGNLPKACHRDELVETLGTIEGALNPPHLLPFGPETVTRIGIVTGSGSFAIELCKDAGIDLLISGESKQEAYHLAKEHSCNAVFAGHYATETFGVRAIERRLTSDFDVETVFIAEPTGI